jgi:hypothetical protein
MFKAFGTFFLAFHERFRGVRVGVTVSLTYERSR